jgi:fructosamine-3-kinase
MKLIKQLHKGESTIELVKVGDKELILRTAELEDIFNEKEFIKELQRNDIITLELFSDKSLKDNQLLLEYINKSPVIADSLTDENIYKWGALVKRIHQIKYNKVFKISSLDEKEYCSWNNFIKERLDIAKLKIDKNKFDLSQSEIDVVKEKLFNFKITEPSDISLLHCDLNRYNVLLKNNELIIFDKGSQIFCGDYLFDLASVRIALTDSQFEAFIKGYGEEFVRSNSELFEFYYLLRTIMRFPNPRKDLIKDVIKNLSM